MIQFIYRVDIGKASGTDQTHIPVAVDSKQTTNSALAPDSPLIPTTEAKRLTPEQRAAL